MTCLEALPQAEVRRSFGIIDHFTSGEGYHADAGQQHAPIATHSAEAGWCGPRTRRGSARSAERADLGSGAEAAPRGETAHASAQARAEARASTPPGGGLSSGLFARSSRARGATRTPGPYKCKDAVAGDQQSRYDYVSIVTSRKNTAVRELESSCDACEQVFRSRA